MGSTLPAQQATENWTASSEFDRLAVQQQLDRLLATPLFNSSKRYPSFLKFVVTHALDGQTDQLKERVLGVEIFGRPADYDTNADPIVRVTAAEIRKRIEQYYQDPRHSLELRFILPSGSYVPHFSWPKRSAHAPAATPLPVPAQDLPAIADTSATPLPQTKKILSKAAVAWTGVVAVAVLAAGVWAWSSLRPPLTKQFWEPFVKSPEPVLFCLADQNQYSSIRLKDAGDPQKEITLSDKMIAIIIDDVSPLVNMAGTLRTYGQTYRVLGESTTTLTDLRRGPSVFIGAFDNSWTLRLTAPLRFHFANDPEMSQLWIEDRANPGKRDWILYRSQQQRTGTYKDYAIVARMVDPNTDHYAVVAAGIGRGGTVAAGEFLVDEHHIQELIDQLPRNWKNKNLEVVLETQVIEDRSGPPRICAVHVW